MKILSGLLFACVFLFSLELSPSQLQMIKEAGYDKTNVLMPQNNVKTEQVVKNDILKVEDKIESELNQFDETETKINLTKDSEQRLDLNLKKELKRYGSLFFNNKNKINPYSIPTPSNYKLNFSDKLSLTIYNGKNESFELTINKDGNIVIPRVGELKVIGLPFIEAKSLIIEESKKAYPTSTNILVDIFEFTSIQITISGLVNAPGFYNLSSFSTIKDALQNSGGILSNGSYRNIHLIREGKTYKVFDLYKLVRYGDSNVDVTLQSGDVILVKPLLKEIKLTGDINYNAYFELKEDESFKDLFDYAAGFKSKANKNAITLKRYQNNSAKVYTLNEKEIYTYIPKTGDEIHIYSTSDIGGNLIKIEGNIVAPGEKELPKDFKLSTFIEKELKQFGQNAYFKKDTNYDYALVQNSTSIKSFDLREIIDKKTELILQAGDEITIFKNSDLKEKSYIYAKGEIVNDKKRKYDFDEGLTASDLFDIVIFNNELIVNGKRISAVVDTKTIQIKRVENNKKRNILLDLEKNKNFKLQKFDEITFFEHSKINNDLKSTINGEVFIPGKYNITENMTINDLVKLSGGLTNKVLMERFEIARYEVKDYKRVRTILTLDLQKALDSKLKIYADDEVTIFPIANWNQTSYVSIAGRVKYPGRYAIEEGEKLSSIIYRAGGFLNNAFIEGAVFTREDIRILQEKRIQESLFRLKNKSMQASASANKIGEKSEDKKNMSEAVKMLEQEVKANKPIGRISLSLFYDLKRFKNSKYDITLKNEDSLFIPTMNDTVSVVGEVLNQTTFVYDKELYASDYLKKAGGTTEVANEEYIYIVKANGEAVKYEELSFFNSGKEIFKGDTLVVPMKLDTISDISFVKDVTAILYQLAITAASLQTVGAI